MSDQRCKEHVHDDFGVGFHQCLNKAVTAAGFCRVHDPELQKQRNAKRAPTRFERENAARERIGEILSALEAQHPAEVAELRKAIWTVQFG